MTLCHWLWTENKGFRWWTSIGLSPECKAGKQVADSGFSEKFVRFFHISCNRTCFRTQFFLEIISSNGVIIREIYGHIVYLKPGTPKYGLLKGLLQYFPPTPIWMFLQPPGLGGSVAFFNQSTTGSARPSLSCDTTRHDSWTEILVWVSRRRSYCFGILQQPQRYTVFTFLLLAASTLFTFPLFVNSIKK